MIKVTRRENESIDSLIKRFNYMMINSGTFEDLAKLKNNFYKKPSTIRQEERKEKMRKIRRQK